MQSTEPPPQAPPPKKIQTLPFYSEWKGHPLADLSALHSHTTSLHTSRPTIFLAGDSSLDNKAWVPFPSPSSPLPTPIPSLYTSTLSSPHHAKPDLAFWLNHLLGASATCLNCATEASLLRSRLSGPLPPHDAFIRSRLRAHDILIVSAGANDIALSPTFSTALHMLALTWLTPSWALRRGWAPSGRYFRRLFRDGVQAYVARLVATTKPRAVLVCMIYFPLERCAGGEKGERGESVQRGWADWALRALGYDSRPRRLQAVIRALFEGATREVRVQGTEVVPVPLFEVLDGRGEGDYVARVEPSGEGGRKLAGLLEGVVRPFLAAG